MITCPNCNHQNPDGALQCEACYTPLPAMVACPSCGTPVQENASFCGQCGNDLRGLTSSAPASNPAPPETEPLETEVSNLPESAIPTQNVLKETAPASTPDGNDFDFPELVGPDPSITPDPITPEINAPENSTSEAPKTNEPDTSNAPPSSTAPIPAPPAPAPRPATTQLQVTTARLRHAQTDTPIEIPRELSVVRIGKPNDQTPPNIDVSGFPDSDIVSRVHANLRVEGDVYYIEDVGSSNGTYINGLPLAVGNRHRLRAGDRIALGKGDKVSFVFENA